MTAMPTTLTETARWERLADELRNFHEVAQFLRPSPGDVPRINGLDLACLTLPLHDVVGGDHVAWIDFERRYDLESARSYKPVGLVPLALEARPTLFVLLVRGQTPPDSDTQRLLCAGLVCGGVSREHGEKKAEG